MGVPSYSASDLDYVSRAYPILDLVRECQDLRDAGSLDRHGLCRPEEDRDQKTLCPVHPDSSPSAKAYVRSNSVYCWVCGKTWTPAGLYSAVHGVPLGRSVQVLLSRLGASHTAARTRDDALSAVTAAIASATSRLPFGVRPPPSPEVVGRTMQTWRDAVRLWAWNHEAQYRAVEEVTEATTWSHGLEPAEEVRVLARYVEWARRVEWPRTGFPGCPPCPHLSPAAIALLPLDLS